MFPVELSKFVFIHQITPMPPEACSMPFEVQRPNFLLSSSSRKG
jgi:hypothetical protein